MEESILLPEEDSQAEDSTRTGYTETGEANGAHEGNEAESRRGAELCYASSTSATIPEGHSTKGSASVCESSAFYDSNGDVLERNRKALVKFALRVSYLVGTLRDPR